MANISASSRESVKPKRLHFFERYLTAWVGLCMVAGLALGKLTPAIVRSLRGMEFGQGSQVNAPIAVLLWR
jgi:ACR3 family arsenite transporter